MDRARNYGMNNLTDVTSVKFCKIKVYNHLLSSKVSKSALSFRNHEHNVSKIKYFRPYEGAASETKWR